MTERVFQLHWQNRANLEQTEFVAQASFDVDGDLPDAFNAWLADVMWRRRHEAPDGWQAVVFSQDSPYFVLSPERSPWASGPMLTVLDEAADVPAGLWAELGDVKPDLVIPGR